MKFKKSACTAKRTAQIKYTKNLNYFSIDILGFISCFFATFHAKDTLVRFYTNMT